MDGSSTPHADHVAVLAPYGRDGEVAGRLLLDAGIGCLVVGSLGALCDVLSDELGAILVAEEALQGPAMARLHDRIVAQPPWSDLPFVVLANGTRGERGERGDPGKDRIDALGNALILSRPLHADELLRAVRSALKARQRQYEARARMADLQAREAELRASEQRFHAIVDSIEHMVWSTRPDGYHDYFNDRWYEYTGVPRGSTDGEAWADIFHPDDQQRTHEIWSRSLRTGEPYQIEYRLRHRSGHYRWVLGRAQAVRDARCRIERWYGTCTDIHEQVMARAALAAYSERLEADVADRTSELDALFTKAPIALHSVDKDQVVVNVSDRWLHLMGYGERGEVVGRHISDFFDFAGKDGEIARDIKSLRDTGTIEESAYTMIRRGGERVDVTIAARMAPGRDAAGARVIVAVSDITERRRAETARDRAETALNQARKLETIGQLSGGIAHDFNNLLMAIRSSLELLERRLPEGDARSAKYVANAVRATERGASLTQRMLAFARKQDLATAAVDTNALIEGMADLLNRSLGPRMEVALHLGQGLDAAFVDPNQLEMAILNLCVNARDALEDEGTVTIETGAVEDGAKIGLAPGRYVRIAVRDEGAGMDAATLAQAVEPFFTTKGIGKGTGLGLPMVYGFATQSGGTFRLASTPGKGTVAEILLPVSAEAETRPPEPAAPAPPTADPPRDRLVILAVDDDVLVLMGTVGLLEDLGHEVLEAYSGPEALKVLATRPDIDLVITDHAMPKMTGVQLAEAIHADRPKMPIILASGYAEMPEGGERHVSARLEKPFGDKGLERVIRQVAGV